MAKGVEDDNRESENGSVLRLSVALVQGTALNSCTSTTSIVRVSQAWHEDWLILPCTSGALRCICA